MLALTLLGFIAATATIVGAVKDTVYPVPGATFEARDYTEWGNRREGKSRRAAIDVKFQDGEGKDDYISMVRLDLVGNSYDRGFAYGKLLNKGIYFLPPPLS